MCFNDHMKHFVSERYKNACNVRDKNACSVIKSTLHAVFVGLISTVITPLDQRLRLKRNPMNPISPCIPLTLVKINGSHFSRDQTSHDAHVASRP